MSGGSAVSHWSSDTPSTAAHVGAAGSLATMTMPPQPASQSLLPPISRRAAKARKRHATTCTYGCICILIHVHVHTYIYRCSGDDGTHGKITQSTTPNTNESHSTLTAAPKATNPMGRRRPHKIGGGKRWVRKLLAHLLFHSTPHACPSPRKPRPGARDSRQSRSAGTSCRPLRTHSRVRLGSYTCCTAVGLL